MKLANPNLRYQLSFAFHIPEGWNHPLDLTWFDFRRQDMAESTTTDFPRDRGAAEFGVSV